MTQTPKMVNRKIVVALAVLCIAALVGLNLSILSYYSEMNNKNTQIQTLNNQIAEIQTQITNTTTSPRLISIGMQYFDNRTDQNAPFLKVTGYICNVGTKNATNCTINISAIQNDNNTAIDTLTLIEPIEAGTYQKIDLQFPYIGTPLTAYTINVGW
jgi:uncharacterized membrane protein